MTKLSDVITGAISKIKNDLAGHDDIKEINHLRNLLAAYEIKYILIATEVSLDSDDKKSSEERLDLELAAENMDGTLDSLIHDMNLALATAGATEIELKIGSEIEITYVPEFATCCGVEMTLMGETNELKCQHCGALRGVPAHISDPSQCLVAESQKIKNGNFKPDKHGISWFQHICAEEPETEIGDTEDPENRNGEKLIARLTAMCQAKNTILQYITVSDIRGWLCEIGRSDLYINVSQIRSRMTGERPPKIPEEIRTSVLEIFYRYTKLSGRAMARGKNRAFYPFPLMKLLDLKLPDGSMRNIFRYIHTQGADTVVKDDLDWKVSCSLLGIEYRPTDISALIPRL